MRGFGQYGSVLLAGVACAAVVEALEPHGPLLTVNSATSGFQGRPRVAAHSGGDFVIVWDSDGNPGTALDIRGQRFSDAGDRLGDELPINAFTAGNQQWPDVAATADGGFIVVWMSADQDGSNYGIFGRRYDSAGAAVGGEFQVNSYTTSRQSYPVVAADPAGGFVVAWNSYAQGGPGNGVFFRRFDGAGAPLSGDISAGNRRGTNPTDPAIAMGGDGRFVLAYRSRGQDGAGDGTFARRFARDGTPLGLEFQVNTFTQFNEVLPTAAMATDGSFVIAWQNGRFSGGTQDGDGYGISAQRYDAGGVPVGGELAANAFAVGQQRYPSVALQESGDYVVVWNSYGQFHVSGALVGRRFRDGVGDSEVEISVGVDANGAGNDVAALGGDRVVVTWAGQSDGAYTGIFARRLGLVAETPTPTVTPLPTETAPPSATATDTATPSPFATATALSTPTATPAASATPSPAAGCAPSPMPCANAGRATLALRRGADGRGTLRFRWRDGRIAPADVGDPLSSDIYRVCLYDDGALRLDAMLPAGAAWRASGSSVRFHVADGAPDGITAARLVPGDGDAEILVTGRGALLAVPALPLAHAAQVVVQLVRADAGACWQAAFVPPARRNRESSFLDQLP